MAKVAIDNGHGKNTAGKRTPPFPDTKKVINEWEFNYATAKILKGILENQGHEVLMVSNTTEDTPLKTRTSKANEWGADVFISIHYNAYTGIWGNHGGIETYYYPSSADGKKLAESVQDELIKETGLRSRGVKSANFQVLRQSKMVAILVECGFMDNLDEAKLMLDTNHQRKCAESIANGVNKYLGVDLFNKVKVRIDDKLLFVNGTVQDKKNYVELRDLLVQMGYEVDWDNNKKEVIVKGGK